MSIKQNCVFVCELKGYLALEPLFQGENGGVDGVLELHVVIVALFQEGLSVDVVFAHRSRLPREVGARRITLKNRKIALATHAPHFK